MSEYPSISAPFGSTAKEDDGIIRWSNISCGVHVMFGLSGHKPYDIVKKVLDEREEHDRKEREAFIVFSDQDRIGNTGGNALYKFIKEHELGDIMEMGPVVNPNSGNPIKVWVWAPPHPKLSNHQYKHMAMKGSKIVKGYHGLWDCVLREDLRFQDARCAAVRFNLKEYLERRKANKKEEESKTPPGLKEL